MTTPAKIKGLARQHKTDLALYVVIGASAFIADFSTLQLTDKVSHNLFIATTCGILVGFVVSYWLNHLRFKKRHTNTRSMKQALPIFIALFVFNTIFTFVCLDYNDKHHLAPRLIIKMGTVGFIMSWNYILFHTVVFRHKTEAKTISKELI